MSQQAIMVLPINRPIWCFQLYLLQVRFCRYLIIANRIIRGSVLLIVHIMFLVVGVEIYCKIRGAFVTEKTSLTNVDNIQAIHSRLGLFFQVLFSCAENVGQKGN